MEGDHIKQRDLGLVGVQMYSFADVWTPMLTEIRCLLSDYLMDTNQSANDGPDSYLGGAIHDSGSDLMRSRRTNRDKNRVWTSTGGERERGEGVHDMSWSTVIERQVPLH